MRNALQLLTLIGMALAVAFVFVHALDRQLQLEAEQSTRAGQLARAFQ